MQILHTYKQLYRFDGVIIFIYFLVAQRLYKNGEYISVKGGDISLRISKSDKSFIAGGSNKSREV